ncbi:uncharacterized protein K02A2.6 [Trichonephila clavipes]|nr:uncharacterized protein K02A2.6 [Trichonephila clavipes]
MFNNCCKEDLRIVALELGETVAEKVKGNGAYELACLHAGVNSDNERTGQGCNSLDALVKSIRTLMVKVPNRPEGIVEQQIAELLRQNQELIRALQNRDNSSNHKVTVQFEKFDEEKENFDNFTERFETFLVIQNVLIANRAKVFVLSLSAKLYQLLKCLLAPGIPSDQTLDKLRDALRKHLTPKPLIIPSRHKFLNRKQNGEEGISTYIAELRALAMNCDYDKKYVEYYVM